MDSNTPATAIPEKDLELNTRALRDCLERVPRGSVGRICDIHYGVGGWAREALDRFPGAHLVGYERDKTVCGVAWKDRRVKLKVLDYRGRVWGGWDLVLADFNKLTQLSRQPLDDLLLATTPRWISFTDVSCGRLHLNWKSYGLRRASLEEYWGSFILAGYELLAYSRRHHWASTAVYQQKAPVETNRGLG